MYRNLVIFSVILTSVIGSQNGFLDGDLDIADGVKLVSIPVSNTLEDETARDFGSNTVLTRIAKFLQGHELHVKLPNLIEKEKLNNFFAESLKAVDETYKENSVVTGRGKKGGGGGIALLGLMFAKTMGAAAIGGLGLLTMKALAASALALLLSAVVGIKKLTSHEEHHDDHQVIYADHHGHHGHRRRREVEDVIPLPYRGWSEYTKEY